jgi:hypothetical protein
VVVLATAGSLLPATPALAGACGPPVPSPKDYQPGLPDVFGRATGLTCGGTFFYQYEEGPGAWYSGPVQGATYTHADVETRRMDLTCSVRDAPGATAGTLRGSVTATSVAPLTNLVSASGLFLDYWRDVDDRNEALYLCTTVTWVDKFGLGHRHRYDADPNAAGDQCPPLLRLVDV